MKKYITAILSIGTVGLLFYTMFDLKNQVKQIPMLPTLITAHMQCMALVAGGRYYHNTALVSGAKLHMR